ncbi:uncharacterized protein LOC119729728 isoform X3 [Patiria miniata]|uniref:Death domain-containing protein n=1 Tax=Patiria miniata TaxID=46514 RepID=A0A914A3F9_PATMI|nr:uncharacterized protein LOC119729728 isoform X3 [Patiria miniata]
MAAQDESFIRKCEKFFVKLAARLSQDWEILAILLDFSSSEVDQIKQDRRNPAFWMLCDLRKRKPSTSTWKKHLIKGLKKIGRNDLVEFVKQQKFLKEEKQSSKTKSRPAMQPIQASSGKPSKEKETSKGTKPDRKNGLQSEGAGSSSGRSNAMVFRPYERPPKKIKAAVKGEGIDVYCENPRHQSQLKRSRNGSWHFWACLTRVLPEKKENVLTNFFMETGEKGKQVHQMITETSSRKLANLKNLTVIKPEKRGKNYTLKFNENSSIYM